MEKIKSIAVAIKDWVMIAPYRFFVGMAVGGFIIWVVPGV